MRELLRHPRAIPGSVKHRILLPFIWRTFHRRPPSQSPDPSVLTRVAPSVPPGDLATTLNDHLRHRFLFGPHNRKEFFLGLLTRLQPYDDILDEGDETREGKFEALGTGLVSVGSPPEWHADVRSGTHWPCTATESLDLIQEGKPSDVKVPWELSRFHQSWWLGKAYWVTGREEYAEAWGQLVDSWDAQNPPGYGVNWANGMEAGIRACNLIAGCAFFSQSRSLSQEFWIRFWSLLYRHGEFIEHHLEPSAKSGNHLIAGLMGLVTLGSVFRGNGRGDRWFRLAVRWLEDEMEGQVLSDGVHYEKSTAYHRFVLEMFVISTLVARRNDHEWSGQFMERLRGMFLFLADVCRADGTFAQINDSDDGRVFRMRRRDPMDDGRHLLSVGAVMFDDPVLRTAASSFHHEALWLTGTEGFERFGRIPETKQPSRSRCYGEGRICILRSDIAHITVVAGDAGVSGRTGHAHAGTGGFELWVPGGQLIVDSGTYAYTSDNEMRRYFRSVHAHNTVVVDGREPVAFPGLWKVLPEHRRPEIEQWDTSVERDTLTLVQWLRGDRDREVVHKRRMTFEKRSSVLIIDDALSGTGTHDVLLLYHLHPEAEVELDANGEYILRRRSSRAALRIANPPFELSTSWYSPSYGVKTRSRVVRWRRPVELPFSTQTTITIQ